VLTALTRKVSPNFASCQLEYLEREAIDVARATAQHREYEAALERLGVRVVSLPTEPDLPDCVFVEDPAVVLEEIAIITRMGTESRCGESESLATALAQFRPVVRLSAPATLEGGDVVRIGKTLYVGLSRRTKAAGARQLAEIVEPHGYRVVPVQVTGCLPLKSACCVVRDDPVFANRALVDLRAFHCKMIDVPAEEPGAADVLRIGNTVLIPASFPRTARLLEQSGFTVQPLDVSELQKAEAGVTCMSLVFDDVARA
jgi:dimethylargininase